MEKMMKDSKFIYKVPGFPVYFTVSKTGKYFVKINEYRGIKNNSIFSLMGVSKKEYEISHKEFTDYVETYNAYCIYIDELSTKIKRTSKRKFTRRKDI